ncbi:hypothetical protein LTS18_005282 [Coniosporium uncinatum]|uniref:Uncharacterized protein n=1 Tax=Coniosporium uncinatum TaxID=93489 RepID=A0ACC3D4S1_9PEZI|nr:hypothetical protein LTS18_005282 [Coniosporium uncinatum]
MDLQFWCQMAVGDKRGGLDWFYQRWPPGSDIDEHGQRLRVASRNTYWTGLGMIGHDLVNESDHVGFDVRQHTIGEAWLNWGVDPIDSPADGANEASHNSQTKFCNETQSTASLRMMEYMLDSKSTTDVISGSVFGGPLDEEVDPTQPSITEKARLSYVQGYQLLEADPVVHYSTLGQDIVTSIAALLSQTGNKSDGQSAQTPAQSFTGARVLEGIKSYLEHPPPESRSRASFAALDLLAEPATPSLPSFNPSGGLTASSIDRPLTILTLDIAPYVRNIVSFDLYLEAQRLRLSNLLSAGGSDRKKARTTRASRSALEGGPRQTTRRERWFHKDLNVNAVLGTAGQDWAGLESRGREETGTETPTNSLRVVTEEPEFSTQGSSIR